MIQAYQQDERLREIDVAGWVRHSPNCAKKQIPFAFRFWSHVLVGSREECWPWLGAKRQFGYGQATDAAGRVFGAHRIAWKLVNGDQGYRCVLHACDNPPCCNPAHLWLGTRSDNNRDMATKRRSTIGSRNPRAKLCDGDVLRIRELDGTVPRATLARRFGVSTSTICDIAVRKSWNHLEGVAP